MKLQGQTVVITGAASGMGRALCFSLGRLGASLGLVDRNEEGARALAEELGLEGIRSHWAVADVRRQHEVEDAIGRVTAQLGGRVDVLVASAGILKMSKPDQMQVAEVEEILQVNFFGVVYAIDAVLPDMLKRQRGHIVGMASLAASRGIPYEAAYGASKAALGNYLESLRPGLRQRGVAVTTVYPGFVRTPLLAGCVAHLQLRSPLVRLLLRLFGPGPVLGVVEPEAAARKITSAILRRRRVLAFPLSTRLLTRLGQRLPAAVYDWLMLRVAARIPLADRPPPEQPAPQPLASNYVS